MKRIIFAVWLILATTGCAKPEPVYLVEYRDVYIPVKCEIKAPERPKYDENAALSVAAIILYVQELEAAIQACKGDQSVQKD